MRKALQMKYYVLLTIKVTDTDTDTEHYIEIGLDYNLPFHPNLTDEIVVCDFPCKINEIYYNLDNLNYVTMRVEAIDNLISMRNNPSTKTIQDWLVQEWNEIQLWAASNNKKVILNDGSFEFFKAPYK